MSNEKKSDKALAHLTCFECGVQPTKADKRRGFVTGWYQHSLSKGGKVWFCPECSKPYKQEEIATVTCEDCSKDSKVPDDGESEMPEDWVDTEFGWTCDECSEKRQEQAEADEEAGASGGAGGSIAEVVTTAAGEVLGASEEEIAEVALLVNLRNERDRLVAVRLFVVSREDLDEEKKERRLGYLNEDLAYLNEKIEELEADRE